MANQKDHLYLNGNQLVKILLTKYGGGETVLFSDLVVKINRKNKEQTRTILITNKAVYNLLPTNQGKCKRRIEFEKISAVTDSQTSDEFAIHVADEYDYRFKSARKQEIINVLKEHTDKLNVKKESLATLEGNIVNRIQFSALTREEKMLRNANLAAVEVPSDEEDRRFVEKDKTAHNIDQHPDMMVNDKVGIADFELLKVLGRGAFGKVMQVKKKSDGKVYAMKILKKAAIVAKNQVEHTKAERKILQALQHPFLMTLRYAFQSKEKLYLVLDYFQGGELFFHLKDQKRFNEQTAKLYVAEIAMAFGHLHSQGVIYRDLKPENILLDDTGHVCLTDFGLAKELEENSKTQTFCGTPEYLAPEIIQGKGHDKAVDWWSLGILLYELTVGIPPFYSQNVNEMYTKIQHGVLRFPPFLSEACKALIVKLLNRDVSRRLGSENDFEELKEHVFFKDLNWDDVYNKKIEVGFKPQVGGVMDTSNFDEDFLKEPVVDSIAAAPTANGEAAFQGFTFKGSSEHLS